MNASVVKPITINAIGVPRNALGHLRFIESGASAADIAIASVNPRGNAERVEQRRDETRAACTASSSAIPNTPHPIVFSRRLKPDVRWVDASLARGGRCR